MTRPIRAASAAALVLAALVGAARCHAQVATAEPPSVASEEALALASMFSDHMVLQREMKVPVWGSAEPGAEVTVKLGDQEETAEADDQGKWQVLLGPFDATTDPLTLSVAAGDETIEVTDVLVGEVWFASGQSNMEWPVSASNDAQTEVAIADWPNLRFITIPNVGAEEPAESFESAGWQPCKPESVGGFSAVAYFFGRELHKELHVPIGLIGCEWGGSAMEAWTSREALNSNERFKPYVAQADAEPKSPEEAEQRKRFVNQQAARLFNGMVAPAIPYGIRGAIWYQGESNAGRHQEYADLSKLMISDWRNRWGQGDFPFLLVQLAAFEPGGESWPYLREAQVRSLEAPNTGMAVAIDIGDRTDIHPRNKLDVGKRLALAARAIAYGQDIVYSGPIYREMEAADGEVRLSFDHVGGGLKADGELRGFQLAGPDGKFVPAQAKIDGAQVVVAAPEVAEPAAVRYSWAAFPEGNLFNVEGLPASPFRTDGGEQPAGK